MAKHVVAKVGEIPAGGRKVVNIKGRSIVVFNVKDSYYALLDRCPHEGAKLSSGSLVGLVESRNPGEYDYSRAGEFIRCPWHGWEYEIRTGKSYCDPKSICVRAYEAGVEGGKGLIEGPYVADTFPVSVDEQYIVVQM